MFFVLLSLFLRCALCLSPGEVAELQHIRSIVSSLNAGDLTGMKLPWRTGDLSDGCSLPGITCAGSRVISVVTIEIFIGGSDNQIFNAALVDYRNFPFLSKLTINHEQMVGDFNLKIPNLGVLRLDGSQSTSGSGGFSMQGTLPHSVFALSPFLEELSIFNFPKLTGTFPSVSALSNLLELGMQNTGMTGPFPNVPFANTPKSIVFIDTLLSGVLPSSYCKALTATPDNNGTGVGFAFNPNLVGLPSCFKTCLSTPINTHCEIVLNNICDIGSTLSDDVSIDSGISGVESDNCLTSADNPCTIGRDNELCLDCTGNPNSGFTYDNCGLCNKVGDPARNACVDCLGVPFGTNIYDICDVCMGNANTCFDCHGVAAGSAVYDICGICQGDGSTCDCAGVTGGTSVVDNCGVCDGNNACEDCFGIPFGSNRYDLCDVCDGNSNTCYDCSGVPAGTKTYDLCGTCGGDGSECDCNGVRLGFDVLDQCDVCGGDGSTCKDCAGVPNGPAVYDVCDVCNGNDTVGRCENPPDDNSAIQAVERTSTSVFIIIIGALALICVITVIVLILTMRKERKQINEDIKQQFIQHNQQHQLAFVGDNADQRGGGGGAPVRAHTNFFLLASVLALALTPTPGNCVLPQTTQFLQKIAQHSNLIDVYPEWFVGANVRPFCVSGMIGLTCVGQDIAEVSLDRNLEGIFDPLDQQFISLLPVATRVRIVDSPLLKFQLDGIGQSLLLKELDLENTGLRGTMPTDIALCQSMTSLVISRTDLEGALPNELGELTLLQNLTISHTKIDSINLVDYGNLNAVTYMDFRSNLINQLLPPQIGTMLFLRELHLANNAFAGTMPSEYQALAFLKTLNLASNMLVDANVGLFDGTFGIFSVSLEVLMLDRNSFGPRLPQLNFFPRLKHLGLSHNAFSQDYNGANGFYYGETGAILLVMLANDNAFNQLNSFVGQPFYGECNFTNNNLCTDTLAIPNIYFTSQCDLGLKPHDCAPDACGDETCRDCTGTPNGMATYDVCDVCAGSATTCSDCAGVPNGPSVYDACHVCNGDGSTCADCAGIPNGSSFYDGCDICNGDDSSCADCAGVPFGSSTYDVCNVCNGRGHTCLDCAGVLLGTSTFDECGVCNGDGLSCADPIIADYLTHQGSFTLFVFLAILLAVLVILAGVLIYLIYNL